MIPLRDEVVTTSTCPVCGTGFTRIRRQRYCSPACRQIAYRRRQPPLTTPTTTDQPRLRREITVYACGQCEQRYLGEQWCHDCNRPCTRLGYGGRCPSCDEPVTVDDLIGKQHDDRTQPQGKPSMINQSQ